MSSTSFPVAHASGTGSLHLPKASDHAGAPNRAGEEPQLSPSALPSASGGTKSITRIFRADLRKSKDEPEICGRVRRLSSLCAQFGNEVLTANYLLYKHGKNGASSGELALPLTQEQVEQDARYRAWGDRLTSFARDAIARRVTGIIWARGREVLRGECSLPTFLRRGSILVRERGVKLWRDGDGHLWISLKVEPDAEPLELDLWVKNLHKSPAYAAVLDRLLDGTHKIGQAQVRIVDGYRVSVAIAYTAEVRASDGPKVGTIVHDGENGFCLQIGGHVTSFEFDVVDAARRKQAIDARRVQCWRLIRGRKLRRRRARIYRSGTLDKISLAWIHYQRTWSQQLAAAIVARAVAAGCGRLEVPSPGTLAEWYPTVLDWTLVASALRNRAEAAGIAVTQIETEREQKRQARKSESKSKHQKAKNEQVAVLVQSAPS